MSAKIDPDEDDREEEDYVEEDDDDDDDDDEGFVPDDADDDEDDDEDDDDDDEVVPLLDGELCIDDENKLHYQGDGFHLKSTEIVPFNILDKNTIIAEQNKKSNNESTIKLCNIEMVGPCDINTSNDDATDQRSTSRQKAPQRKLHIQWTIKKQSTDNTSLINNGNNLKASTKLKSTGDSDDDDNDNDDGKMPSIICQIHGSEDDGSSISGNDRIQFYGEYHPIIDDTNNNNNNKIKFIAQVRIVQSNTAVSTTVAAAAAAAAARPNNDDDDIINKQNDNNNKVEYDELIALHEDATISVDTLRKRYRSNNNGGKTEEDEVGKKKNKKSRGKTTDDDDDDDIGF